ncbi:hypothetical protein [Burkholderia pyrrocinia]|uniref:hypothetical protein n=1 Tax=Burkholderia pyrrocinia TaxID=60550 RepID=UPI001FB24284|nr:hypothetical protein [Burkholderia pyrrocinia]UOB56779.1 hypothetical protein MRS60_06660 [Burkholderia pyrrocinia]
MHDVVFAGGSLAADPFGNGISEAGNTESRAVYDYRKGQRLHIAGERIEYADGRREMLIP